MDLLDRIKQKVDEGVERAKFETDKFQRTSRLQSEISELQHQYDAKLAELGMRAYELQRAGQIAIPSIADLARALEQLRSGIVVKEEDLKATQNQVFQSTSPANPTPIHPAAPQSVPISYAPPQPAPVQQQPPAAPTVASQASTPNTAQQAKTCPKCGFQMPSTSRFCPSCGLAIN